MVQALAQAAGKVYARASRRDSRRVRPATATRSPFRPGAATSPRAAPGSRWAREGRRPPADPGPRRSGSAPRRRPHRPCRVTPRTTGHGTAAAPRRGRPSARRPSRRQGRAPRTRSRQAPGPAPGGHRRGCGDRRASRCGAGTRSARPPGSSAAGTRPRPPLPPGRNGPHPPPTTAARCCQARPCPFLPRDSPRRRPACAARPATRNPQNAARAGPTPGRLAPALAAGARSAPGSPKP